MMRRFALTLMISYFIACGLRAAKAEQLVLSLSNQRVEVTSSFVGENLVLFGTIEPDPGTILTHPSYDLVVTAVGPPKALRTRRKERILRIWINVDSRDFVQVPSYLAIISNRPTPEIAKPEIRRRLQVGIDNYLLRQQVRPRHCRYGAERSIPHRLRALATRTETISAIGGGRRFSHCDRFSRHDTYSRQCADGKIRRRRQTFRQWRDDRT